MTYYRTVNLVNGGIYHVRVVTREERNEESPILRSCLFIYKIQFGKICIPINRDVPIASFEL